MMYSVPMPSFAPASSIAYKSGDDKIGQELGFQNNGDTLDFDLLAEYLLEDHMAVTPSACTGDVTQSKGFASALNSCTLAFQGGAGWTVGRAADQDQYAFADPLADGTIPLTHGTGPQTNNTHPAGNFVQVQPVGVVPAPVSSAPLAHLGMTLPAPACSTLPASAPNLPRTGGSDMLVYHHAVPSSSANKRPYPDISANSSVSKGTLSRQMDCVHYLPGGKKQKNQAQIDRRRERNRILARRTRLRKKFFFESLQKEVTDLQRENTVLKEIVKAKLDAEIAVAVLADCHVGDLPSVVVENSEDDAIDLDQQDFNLVCSLKKSQQCFVITDPSLQDNPIVYASEDFLQVTGYSRDEVLGRNCRFLQGVDTSPEKVEMIRKSLMQGEDVRTCFLNYTADGTPFWNQLFIAALRDTQNNIVNFIGVIVKVAGPPPDDSEYGKLETGEKSYVDNEAKTEGDEVMEEEMVGAVSDVIVNGDAVKLPTP